MDRIIVESHRSSLYAFQSLSFWEPRTGLARDYLAEYAQYLRRGFPAISLDGRHRIKNQCIQFCGPILRHPTRLREIPLYNFGFGLLRRQVREKHLRHPEHVVFPSDVQPKLPPSSSLTLPDLANRLVLDSHVFQDALCSPHHGFGGVAEDDPHLVAGFPVRSFPLGNRSLDGEAAFSVNDPCQPCDVDVLEQVGSRNGLIHPIFHPRLLAEAALHI